MAEKVRYYLEQSVPELEDLKRKGLFDKGEITMIMRRRTDFEHRITGRGAKPRDFLKYTEFETNLEKLRKKRYVRLSRAGLIETKPSISDWAGMRRVLFVFDRATRKFPGDLNIWGSYLRFARKNGAIKVIYRAYTRLLQLQPRNVDAWISAAKYEFEDNANAKGARTLLQKGLRFNPESMTLWLSYAKFELAYITRLLARRRVLGLITEKQQQEQMDSEQQDVAKSVESSANLAIDEPDHTSDKIVLPSVTNEDLREELNQLPEADINMLGNPDTNPALRGNVVLAVFDVAMPSLLKTMPSDEFNAARKVDRAYEIAHEFLAVFDQFTELDRPYLSGHVVDYLNQELPNDARTKMLDVVLPLRTMSFDDNEFATTLQFVVNKFIAYKSKMQEQAQKDDFTAMFTTYLQERFLQSDPQPTERIQTLLQAIIKKVRN
ncbi:hypothetical protein BABINDRAFT_32808 [Babjeviella inositovora NRRL Y-12698]|uniref:U3 small nucleolar RNA-associated protein 6 N-terminal domain-containing protein n=1 Tax=Babjeviella inositovora NRRL Y-12698 TaxID=984486 RepID=A0A1E3QW33_9ASCO|nr:uncharacterized protein BABINDRAFT_32808 [Babjeviella inositovora NRRL Y-12698]ODQ81868.1 hypothetical protein BABINDRAFT_32808 [Babjeviella inositovora NRRL Y-12698]